MKKKFVLIDENLVDEDYAQISVLQRGFLYGDGLFETCRIWQGEILNFRKHEERMARGLDLLRFPSDIIDFSKLKNAIKNLIETNEICDGLLRINVSRGLGGSGYLPAKVQKPLIVAQTMPLRALPNKISIGISKYLAFHQIKLAESSSARFGIKSMNSLPYILNKIEADQSGLFDLLMLDESGIVCETSASNIFWIKDNKIYTPADHLPIVHGCVRETLCEANNLKIEKIDGKIDELINADEIFLTNAANLVIGVNELVFEDWLIKKSQIKTSSRKFKKIGDIFIINFEQNFSQNLSQEIMNYLV